MGMERIPFETSEEPSRERRREYAEMYDKRKPLPKDRGAKDTQPKMKYKKIVAETDDEDWNFMDYL